VTLPLSSFYIIGSNSELKAIKLTPISVCFYLEMAYIISHTWHCQ